MAASHSQARDWAHSPTQLNILRNQYSSLLQNHQKLRTEYQKLLSVTSELTSGLENVAQSKERDVDWKNVKILLMKQAGLMFYYYRYCPNALGYSQSCLMENCLLMSLQEAAIQSRMLPVHLIGQSIQRYLTMVFQLLLPSLMNHRIIFRWCQ